MLEVSASAAFISYCRDDSEFALRLAQDLKSAHAAVWIDQLDIPAGKYWDTTVQDALIAADRIVVILSPNSSRSNNVLNEISFALDQGKTIIPVIYRDCIVPVQIHRNNRIDFRADYTRGLASLISTLQGSHANSQVLHDDTEAKRFQKSKNLELGEEPDSRTGRTSQQHSDAASLDYQVQETSPKLHTRSWPRLKIGWLLLVGGMAAVAFVVAIRFHSARIWTPAPASGTGTLLVQGNIADFNIAIDGNPRGVIAAKEGSLTLDPGQHIVRYSNQDGTDIQEHVVQIAAGKSTIDNFTLTDNMVEYPKIQEALRSFEQAYESRNIDRVRATWLNIGPRRSKSLAEVLQVAEMISIHEVCAGHPSITGNTATQNCTEIAEYEGSSNTLRELPKTITFVKIDGNWVMEDKLP